MVFIERDLKKPELNLNIKSVNTPNDSIMPQNRYFELSGGTPILLKSTPNPGMVANTPEPVFKMVFQLFILKICAHFLGWFYIHGPGIMRTGKKFITQFKHHGINGFINGYGSICLITIHHVIA